MSMPSPACDLTLLHGRRGDRTIATVDKHFTYHALQMMTRGRVVLFHDDRRWELSGVTMWICFPGPRIRFHEWPRGQPWAHRYVAFEGAQVAAWQAEGLIPTEPVGVPAGAVESIAGQFDQMLELKDQPGVWSQRRAANLLEAILLQCAEFSLTPHQARPDWLIEAMGRLQQFDRHEVDYRRLARQLNMSATTFRRRFKRMTGMPPHQYRLACRVAEARRRLGSSDAPIKRIADELGYTDVFYFSRQFKQVTGVSPAHYRRSSLAAAQK